MNARMEEIDELGGSTCPTCGAGLRVMAARHEPLGRPTPIHVVDGKTPPWCPNGHVVSIAAGTGGLEAKTQGD